MSATRYSLRASLYATLTGTRRPDVPISVALRNTLGVVLPLAIGFASGHAAAGLGIAAGALNVMFSDQPGPYRQRLQVIATVSLAAALSALLGFLIGAYTPALILAVLVSGFAGGLMVVFGAGMARVGMTSMILLVITAASPLPWRQALAAAALILAGGLLQALLSIAAWPLQRYRPERMALATVYRDLAALAREPLAETDAPPASDALTSLQHTLLGPHQAHGRAMEAFRVLLELAERIRLELMALTEPHPDTPGQDMLRTRSADVLAAVAAALESGTAPTRAETALNSLQAEASTTSALAACLRTRQAQALLGQLAAATRNANWAGSRGEQRAHAAETALPKALRGSAPVATLRANLTLSSVALRHALRWAACIALAVGIGRYAGLPHGYWLPMTAAIVLRPDFGATFNFGLLRVLGTVLGLMLTTALLRLSPNDIWAHLALMALLCFGFRYLATAHYGIAVAALTGTVVILLAFEGVAPDAAVVDRVINTALGSGMALLAYLIWPTWERGRARIAMARMLDAYAVYLRTLAPATSTLERRDARTAARAARSNAQASLARLRAEPGSSPEMIDMAEALFANGNRLARTAMALEAFLDAEEDLSCAEALADFTNPACDALGILTARLDGAAAPTAIPDLRQRQQVLADRLAQDAGHGTETALVTISDRLVDNINTLAHIVTRAAPALATPAA